VLAFTGGTEGIQRWLGGDSGHPGLGFQFLFSLLLGASLLISPFPDSVQLNNVFAAQVWQFQCVQLMSPDVFSASWGPGASPAPQLCLPFCCLPPSDPSWIKNTNQSEQLFRPTLGFNFDLLSLVHPTFSSFLNSLTFLLPPRGLWGSLSPGWEGPPWDWHSLLKASAPTGKETSSRPPLWLWGNRHHGRAASLPLLVCFLSSFPYPSPWVSPTKQTLDLLGSSYISLKSSIISHLCTYDPCTVAQSCPTLCDPKDHSTLGSFCPWDFPGKNTGVGCHFLLQGIFLTQGSNAHLWHCRRILHQWATWEAPFVIHILEGFVSFLPRLYFPCVKSGVFLWTFNSSHLFINFRESFLTGCFFQIWGP